MADEMDQILQEVMGGEPEVPEDTTPDVEDTTPDDTEDLENPEQGDDQEEKPKAPPKQNKAWAQMRVQNKQYEQALANLAKQQGMTVEELLDNLQNETDKKVAEKQGISPEIQRQLRQQQEELNALREERNRDRFRSGIQNLRTQFDLGQEDMYAFIDQAREMGIDLINSPLPMDVVYKALNYETLVNQAVEKATQEYITQQKEIEQRSPSNTKFASRPKGNGQKQSLTPEQALKDLFEEGLLG